MRKLIQQSGIFPAGDELLLQALGIGMLALATLGMFLFYHQGPQEWLIERVLVHSLLFNYVHVGFTLALLWQVYPMRQLMSANDRPWGLQRGPLIAAVILACLWACQLNGIWKFRSLDFHKFDEVKISWLLFSLWGMYHFMSQTFGISALYTSRTLAKSAQFERARLEQAQRLERIGFRALFLFILLGRAIHLFMGRTPYLRVENKFTMAVACLIIANSLRFKNPLKTCFLLRVLVYPFLEWNPFFLFAAQALHGTEYMLLSRRLFLQSKASKVFGISLFALLLGVVYCAVQVTQEEFSNGLPGGIRSEFQWLAAMALLLAVMHYYLDGFLFRFSNASVSEFIAPTLMPWRSKDLPETKLRGERISQIETAQNTPQLFPSHLRLFSKGELQ